MFAAFLRYKQLELMTCLLEVNDVNDASLVMELKQGGEKIGN